MEALGLILLVGLIIVAFNFIADRANGFADPSRMTDKEILSAIAGQADWLEMQYLHVLKFGGAEPHPDLAESRREYIVKLCEAIISRHPKPINLMYSATKCAKQLEDEGIAHKTAVVHGVKQRLFEDNGVSYRARWHPVAQ